MLQPALATLILASCTGGTTGESATGEIKRIDGAASRVEEILFGSDRCSSSRECLSGYCSMGMCIGYLAGSTERVRGRMAPGLVGAARDPAVSRELTDSLILVLQDAGSDPYHRARAADALRHVRCEDCPRSLAGVLEDPQEPVRFFAARSLHHLGDARGTRALEVFSQHSSEAVRALARMALETVTE